MGLTRYSRPEANSTTGGNSVTLVGSTTLARWEAMARPFNTYVARGSGGGVDTDPIDDGIYLRYINLTELTTLVFNPISTDDPISSLTFHVRMSGRFSTLTPYVWRNGVATAIVADDGSTGMLGTDFTFMEYTFKASLDPVTGKAWSSNDIGMGDDPNDSTTNRPEFQFKMDKNFPLLISRIYIEAMSPVGPTLGRHLAHENWRYCDVCGLKTKYSRVERPAPPHPQAGLVVCTRCYDQPDHDTIKIMNKRVPHDIEDVLY